MKMIFYEFNYKIRVTRMAVCRYQLNSWIQYKNISHFLDTGLMSSSSNFQLPPCERWKIKWLRNQFNLPFSRVKVHLLSIYLFVAEFDLNRWHSHSQTMNNCTHKFVKWMVNTTNNRWLAICISVYRQSVEIYFHSKHSRFQICKSANPLTGLCAMCSFVFCCLAM